MVSRGCTARTAGRTGSTTLAWADPVVPLAENRGFAVSDAFVDAMTGLNRQADQSTSSWGVVRI